MILRTITAVGFFNEFRPCKDYPLDRLGELWQGRELNALDILSLDIPLEDRLWGAIRMVDTKTQRLFACDCAERALKRERDAGREPDERSWNAVSVARRYAHGGATEEELQAAWGAAWDVAESVASASNTAKTAYKLAAAAAWATDVSTTAAWYAVAASWVVASASSKAGGATERHRQVKRLKEMLVGAK